MRTREPIQCMCDGCNKLGTGHRVTATVLANQGAVPLAKMEPPQGWRVAIVRPALATVSGEAVDAGMDAQTLARATGQVVEAALCEKCQRKATFVPIPEEPVVTRELDRAPGVTVDPAATDVDERALERDRERAEQEAAAEAAERAAYEAKRQQAGAP